MALQLILVFILLFGSSLRLLEPVTASRRLIVGRNETDRLASVELIQKKISIPYEGIPYGGVNSLNNSNNYYNRVGIKCGHQQRPIIITGGESIRRNKIDQLALVEFKKQIDDPYGALRGNGLRGNISPSIGNLTFLHSLIIENNRFHGKIPQEIGNLIRLQNISFQNNNLKGELPTSLANCTRLREIYFSCNNLVGKIPVELTSLSKLEVISIYQNSLTGEIPASFGNISSFRSITLDANGLQWSIPESFGQLTNLKVLSLYKNKLSGMFPVSLYNLSSLKIIYLSENQFHGILPRDIGFTLPKLYALEIGNNLFSGRFPNSISNISTLGIIDFCHNSFIGPVPSNLADLQNLRLFFIAGNQCGGGKAGDLDFVNSLINCTHLETVDLRLNGFEGTLPNFKANLSTQLSQLYLGDNRISGTIPADIENLVNLTLLDMTYNFLEGNISSSIGKLPKLQKLLLNGNRLSGQIPSSIGNLTLLYELHLGANNLNASIPSSLGNCKNLQYLNLGDNNLQGPIPKQLFCISSLSTSLNLSNNSLVGSLPIEIGNLKSLSTIDVSKNKFFGEIPSSIGDCNSLEHLYMGSNFFKGTIPQSLTLLKGLQDLVLSLNNLSGQIPKDLEKLVALQRLNLSFNNLEGEVPTKGIFGNASAVEVNGNEKLCGGIAELQLPTCTNHGYTKREKSNAFGLVVAIISAVLGFLLISSFLILFWIRRSKSKPPSTPLIGDLFLRLSYKELFQATGGFSSANFIGSGSFGSVYKGIIDQDETIVAVKVLNLQNSRVYKSFMSECKVLRNIRHRNLVKIITSCSSLDSKGKDFKALVYEFMPNGNLDDWLHMPMEVHNHSRNLNLLQRLNIAIDVASALDYLHYHCYATIVHCDLKPSNILLDNDMTAHVGDFGLARLLLEPDDDSSHAQSSTIGIKGSIGYVAPGNK
ncbi:probable LRR receptor-like serine/threonine-protein kinase At3g47570 [Telopea speciosissima]|uniref:probable LRR receptor-like serine/threonine-protein kinase At3g47570 n=1 Tax=Telopea speciosissima TaxID=54955 RepID=UPI001CC4511E|nr:probable LRR receptor-like serine/threonine-protein kinase At3g47570 [Telopea speciosissima]